MDGGKRLAAKKGGFFALLERMGVTNCLGFLLVFLLLLGLVGGFVLAVLSIKYQYTPAPWPAGRWYLPPSARPSPL